MCGKGGITMWQNVTLDPYLTHYVKISSRLVEDLNVKGETRNPLYSKM